MPAFMELAAISTSGTNSIPSRKSMPTMVMPATRASSSTRVASQPRSSRICVPSADLVSQAVVQVVMHLLDQFIVRQLRENDVFFVVVLVIHERANLVSNTFRQRLARPAILRCMAN